MKNVPMGVRLWLAACAAVVLVTVAVSTAAATPSGGCSTTAGITACTFSYSAAQESWVAPAGVSSVTVDAYGAAGHLLSCDFADTTGCHRNTGLGAHVQATVAVTPGTTYYVTVGGHGDGTTGGFNGGGNGGTYDFGDPSGGTFNFGEQGGGGGGATDFRTSTALSGRIVVAGGGGGDAWPTRGGDSGHDGNDGVCADTESSSCVRNAGGGQAGTSGGALGGLGESVDAVSGENGANVAAGAAAGGAGASWPAPFDDNTFFSQYGGGGGGGGYYGGGGGGAGMQTQGGGLPGSDGGGSGGGGSDYVDPSATNVTISDGTSLGDGSLVVDGSLVITYTEPNPTYQIQGFLSPASKSKWKTGSSVPVKVTLSIAGTQLSDSAAQALLSPTCHVFFSVSTTPPVSNACMKYDIATHQFQYNWKVANNTKPATVSITVTGTNPDGSTNATKTESITITK